MRQRCESAAGGHVQGTGEVHKRAARSTVWELLGDEELMSGEGFPEQVPLGLKTSSLPHGRQAQGISAGGQQGLNPQKCPDTWSNVCVESSLVCWYVGDVIDESEMKLEW